MAKKPGRGKGVRGGDWSIGKAAFIETHGKEGGGSLWQRSWGEAKVGNKGDKEMRQPKFSSKKGKVESGKEL